MVARRSRLGHRRRGFCSAALRDRIDSLELGADPQRCILLAQECAAQRALPEARRLHSRIKEFRLCRSMVANSIILMYAKCGSLDEARQVFDAMEKRDIYSWTVMVNGLARSARSKEAFDLFNDMLGHGLRPHSATFVAVLNACSRPVFIDQGRSLHRQLTQLGLQKNVVVATALLTMYSKCGRLDESVNMFNAMGTRNLVSWNAMIAAYAEHGRGMEALQVLRTMQHEGLATNESTYLSLMRAYRDPSRLALARQVHQLVVQAGLEQDIVVATTLVDMYAKCCSLENAKAVFDKQGHSGEALCLFRKLQLSVYHLR